MDALVEEIREKILNDEGTHEEQVLIDHIATLTEQMENGQFQRAYEDTKIESDRLKIVVSELQASNAGIRDEKLRIAELEAELDNIGNLYDRRGDKIEELADRSETAESHLATAVEGLEKFETLCEAFVQTDGDATAFPALMDELRVEINAILSQIEQTPSAATDPAISAEASGPIIGNGPTLSRATKYSKWVAETQERMEREEWERRRKSQELCDLERADFEDRGDEPEGE